MVANLHDIPVVVNPGLLPVAPASRTLRQGDLKLEVSLGCMVSPCGKDKTKQDTDKNA